MPLWLRVSRRLGKRTGLLAASGLFAVAAAGLLRSATPGGTGWSRSPLVVLVGVGYAGMQMFPLAMLPDVIAADEAASGERRAGVFTGVWTAAETLGLAVGPGLLGGLLALAGYVSSTGDEVVAQSGHRGPRRPARASASCPPLLVLASLPVLARYRLDPVPAEEPAA